MSQEDDDVEYCAECGDPEFDEDGNETHADEDEYDHDFELESDEEDEGLTLDDVKKGADTLTSIAKAAKAFKDLSDDNKPKKGYRETSTPRPSVPDQRKPGWWGSYVLKPRKEKSEVEEKLGKIEKKIDHGHKSQNRKWYIAIGIGFVIAVVIALLF